MPRGLVVKDAPYNVRKSEVYRVLTRNMHPDAGDRLGKWEPVSRWGWTVLCLSKKDAIECVLWVGGQMYPRPAQQGGTVLNEESYERWLLRHHFYIERTEVTGKREMAWDEFHNGWVPGDSGSGNELFTGQSSPAITYRTYENRFAEGARGTFLNALHDQISARQ